MTADLHCHSTFSDGNHTPGELIQIALSKGLAGLSITDHDTVEGYPSFLAEAQKHQFRVISGVEFSCSHRGSPVHILGYSFQLAHPAIQQLTAFHKTRRIERNQEILIRLSKQGIRLSLEEIKELMPEMSSQIGRAHIAYALYKKGLVPNPQTVFEKWIGEKKPCYVESEHPTIEATLAALHAARGFAVIAHPHLIKKKSTLRSILAYPFDGIEARYAFFKPSANQRFLDLAQAHQLFVTGGSDFHGAIRPQNTLGSSTTDPTTFLMLEERFLNRH